MLEAVQVNLICSGQTDKCYVVVDDVASLCKYVCMCVYEYVAGAIGFTERARKNIELNNKIRDTSKMQSLSFFLFM